MCPSCTPAPLACNLTSQSDQDSAGCCVLPAASTFHKPQLSQDAPALKSTNANLWDAWDLQFQPLLTGGGWGSYDSADLVQARYMLETLRSAGVTFYITV